MKSGFLKKIKQKKLIFIYFVDQSRTFFPQVQEKLSDERKYRVHLFMSSDALCNHLKTSDIDNSWVNIFFLNDDNDKNEKSEKEVLIRNVKEIKKIDRDSNIFVLTNKEDVSVKNDLITAGAIGIIPKNESSVLRIQNHVKGLISEKNLEKKRKERLLPVKILILFIILVIVAALIAYLIKPEIFYT